MKTGQKGFTLIEVLMVISIIGLMASLTIANLSKSTKKSRDAQRKNDIAELRKAIKLYFDDHGNYPPNVDDDGAGWDDSSDGDFLRPLVEGGYVKSVVLDPRNVNDFKYSYQYYPLGSTSCNADLYVLGVRQFENDPPIPTYAQCPSGENWEALFDYVLLEE